MITTTNRKTTVDCNSVIAIQKLLEQNFTELFLDCRPDVDFCGDLNVSNESTGNEKMVEFFLSTCRVDESNLPHCHVHKPVNLKQ